VDLFHQLFGPDKGTLLWWQMSARALLVFFYMVLLARAGFRRSFGKFTTFDIVLAVILGSTLSRCLTGNAPLLPTLAASAVLVAVHSFVAMLTVHSHAAGKLLKGEPVRLVDHGRPIERAMRRTGISERDLLEALRSGAHLEDPSRVKAAYLERNGGISVILEEG
jgi:uncharacterized membrane protein YcaP (DUF421 family)